MVHEYKDVFQGLGRLKQTHSIKLRLECECECRVPYHLQEQFDKTLSNMEREEISTKVTEPTEWVTPLVTVRNCTGTISALRICLD